MKNLIAVFLFLISFWAYAQDDSLQSKTGNDSIRKSLRQGPKQNPKAPHKWYRIYSIEKDTVYVDTSLSIKSEYKFNYLRKDNFGLLVFNNDGHTYNTLHFGFNKPTAYPEFGFKAKQFNYYKANEINYYSVATPLTELYFKTVLKQGQNVDAFVTVNTSRNFNLSIGYKGLRSLGKYVNDLASTGNFKFTASYFTLNKRYNANFHYASQDIFNNENGGIIENENFTSGDSQFKDRARLEVYLEDASTMFKGKRYFIDHSLRINKNESSNNVYLEHQFSYETKFFEFKKATQTDRFGDSYLTSNYVDLTKNNIMYNKLGATFSNSLIGKFNFFVEDFQYNYFYNRYIISNNQIIIPNSNNNKLNAVGGKYFYNKNKIFGYALFSKGISKQTFSTLDVSAKYNWSEKNNFSFQYVNISKVPDMNYTLYQSDFIRYNWFNSFKNEKINTLKITANTQWLNAEAQISTLNDYLYFSNDDVTNEQILVTPKQYNGTINYLSLKASKEIKIRKWALDNTVLYQQVAQNENVLNVPQIVTRNSLYFTDQLFKKAMLLQTGVTFQYFSKYNANAYNPLISEFYVQNNQKIGGYPLVDFFVNARVQQARIFLKAEHFNSSFSGNNHFSAPNYPYKDFIVRFGIVWNFFQ